jgi:hypothetical protein
VRRGAARQLYLTREDLVVMIDQASGGGGEGGTVDWAAFLSIMDHSCWY